MKANFKIGQQVRHEGFKGLGSVVRIYGGRIAVNFPGTNGIIDDWCNFTAAKAIPPKRRRRQSCSLIRGEYD
jgi:hypothetical protein